MTRDFEQARIDGFSILTISRFVDADSIDPIFFDTSCYVAPNDGAGQDVFIVLHDAIRKSGTAALSRVVIARRARAVAILLSGKGLVCHTLHDPHDLWDAGPIWQDLPNGRPDPSLVTLAMQPIQRQNGKFQPDDTQDRYEARLPALIEAKLKGEGITPEQPDEPDRGNVVDLMAALKASLGQETSSSTAKKKPRRRRAS